MGDPYWRYGASSDKGAYSGYIPSDPSTLPSQPWRPSSDYLQKDILGEIPGPSSNGYPSSTWEDSYFTGRRDDAVHGTGAGISSVLNDRPDSLRKADGVPVGGRESNVLFVNGLPSDCTRREVSHLFRPFPGFQEIRLVHKEPRHSADKSMVLCFVEFSDSKRALTALEALQGYKFDNKKPNSPALQIHFAHFPFQLPPSDNAPIPSQPPPSDARFLSQPPLDSAVYPSKLPHDAAHFPSEQPPRSYQFSSQLRSDSVVFSSKLLPESAHYPSKLPPDSAHSPYQLAPHREEQDLGIPREKELVDQDEEPVVMTKKFKHGSSIKKENKESIEAKKKWCIKCKQNHFGECYNYKGCYICGKPGHIGKDCTSQPRLCYGCGEPGHKHSVCPNGPGPGEKGKGRGSFVKKKAPPET